MQVGVVRSDDPLAQSHEQGEDDEGRNEDDEHQQVDHPATKAWPGCGV